MNITQHAPERFFLPLVRARCASGPGSGCPVSHISLFFSRPSSPEVTHEPATPRDRKPGRAKESWGVVKKHDVVEREGDRRGDISCGEKGGWRNRRMGQRKKFSSMLLFSAILCFPDGDPLG